jgi:hypothetical protein
MLDCEFAPLTGEYFNQALDGGMRYNPAHRHYDEDGNRKAGRIRFTGESLRGTGLRDVEWKKGTICNHYEYTPDSDTHGFFFTTPDLMGVHEGAVCPDIKLADVADSWPENLEALHSAPPFEFSGTNITINPKPLNPVLPNPVVPWATPTYPNTGGGWQTATTSGSMGTTSSIGTIGSSAFDPIIDFGTNSQHTSGYVHTDPGASSNLKAQLDTIMGTSMIQGAGRWLPELEKKKEK